MKPKLLILDSIQTVYMPEVSSAPGSVSQLRECTGADFAMGKGLEISIIVVGHVTKDGSVAGPRVLEHMVDTVLFFEGERHNHFRILRALKTDLVLPMKSVFLNAGTWTAGDQQSIRNIFIRTSAGRCGFGSGSLHGRQQTGFGGSYRLWWQPALTGSRAE